MPLFISKGSSERAIYEALSKYYFNNREEWVHHITSDGYNWMTVYWGDLITQKVHAKITVIAFMKKHKLKLLFIKP